MSIRNIRRSVLIAAGVGALAVSGLFAGRLMARQMEHRGGGGAGAAQHMFSRIARHLDLTDAQQAQIRAVLKTHASEIQTHVKAGMAARRALHDAVMAQPTDEAAIRSLGQQMGATHADGALIFARIRAEIWPILTPEQQEKMQSFHARMQGHGDAAMQSLGQWLRGES